MASNKDESTESRGAQHLPALATILSGALAVFLVLVVQETFLLAIAGALACVIVYIAMWGARKWYTSDKKITTFEERGLQTFQFFSWITYYVTVQFVVILLHFIVASYPLPSVPTLCLMMVVLLFLLIVILPHIITQLTKNFVW